MNYELNTEGGWIVPDNSTIPANSVIPSYSELGNGCELGTDPYCRGRHTYVPAYLF